MSLFDLLFILVFLGACVSIGAALVLWISGRRPTAWRVARFVGLAVLVYGVALVIVSIVSPPREVGLGQDRCYDDWCIAVMEAGPRQADGASGYAVTFGLSNRALRVTQRELGLNPYLLDQLGRRYEPRVTTSEPPFDVALRPGEAIETTRWYDVPADAGALRLAIVHEGWAAGPGLLIIGDDASWLHPPAIVRLPAP